MAGSVVAVGAMATAIWQARIARTSSRAAMEQVQLYRRQLVAEAAERDLRDAPEFSLAKGRAELGECQTVNGSVQFVPMAQCDQMISSARWANRRPVRIDMTGGPAVSVQVALHHDFGDRVHCLDVGPYQMIKDSRREFTLISAYRLKGMRLEVVITSTESQSDPRIWTNRYEIEL
jgi:hypothetical protein